MVIDTCVWVAAVRSRRGASFALLSEIPSRRFHFGTSVALFLEYRAQLTHAVARGSTTLSPLQIDTILAALAYHTVEVPIFYRLRPNLKDANDDKVFECAAHFGADAIVTHNTRDFLNSELNYQHDVLSPGEFLQRMRRDT
ncbi:MAG: putative toxin-antitoxin system toxin component, PIN family [Spirochaetaceae bacterium]|nr:putative toxin-antitoxin system toxin component, PIN family [Spirochaetaceae bacterium]